MRSGYVFIAPEACLQGHPRPALSLDTVLTLSKWPPARGSPPHAAPAPSPVTGGELGRVTAGKLLSHRSPHFPVQLPYTPTFVNETSSDGPALGYLLFPIRP